MAGVVHVPPSKTCQGRLGLESQTAWATRSCSVPCGSSGKASSRLFSMQEDATGRAVSVHIRMAAV